MEKIQVSNSIQSDDSLNEDISDEDKVVQDYMECYRMPHDSMKMYSWYHPINSGEFSIKQMQEMMNHDYIYHFTEEQQKLHVMSIKHSKYFSTIDKVLEQFKRDAKKDQMVYYEEKIVKKKNKRMMILMVVVYLIH